MWAVNPDWEGAATAVPVLLVGFRRGKGQHSPVDKQAWLGEDPAILNLQPECPPADIVNGRTCTPVLSSFRWNTAQTAVSSKEAATKDTLISSLKTTTTVRRHDHTKSHKDRKTSVHKNACGAEYNHSLALPPSFRPLLTLDGHGVDSTPHANGTEAHSAHSSLSTEPPTLPPTAE